MSLWKSRSYRLSGQVVDRLVLCAVLALAGCGGDDNGGSPAVVLPSGTAVTTTVTGIAAGSSLVLTDNGADALTVSSDGTYVFPARVAAGGRFGVAVSSISGGQSCSVLFGSGPVSDDVAVRSSRVVCGPAEAHVFSSAADMVVARQNHQLVKLGDGAILAFGGDPSVEQYASKSNVWTPAGAIPGDTTVVSAAVSSGTKVLLSVVKTSTGATVSPLLYDAATRTTSSAPAYTAVTYAPQLITLLNGRTLAFDGNTGAAELYDPATNRWTATGAATSGANLHPGGAIALMADGNVMYAAGNGPANTVASYTEIYNVATGTWSRTGDTRVARRSGLLVLLPNGRLLLVGGTVGVYRASTDSGPAFVTQAEVYDPPSQQWFYAGVLSAVRPNFTATLIPSGKVLLAGGNDPGSFGYYPTPPTSQAAVEAYDPATNTIAAWGTLNQARTLHAAILTNEGRLLVSGGTFSPLNNPNNLFGGFTTVVLRSSELGS